MPAIPVAFVLLNELDGRSAAYLSDISSALGLYVILRVTLDLRFSHWWQLSSVFLYKTYIKVSQNFIGIYIATIFGIKKLAKLATSRSLRSLRPRR
jgi:hypothetical protein